MTASTNSLSDRDLDVLRLVARFKQVTSRQVSLLLFEGTSYTPANRTLRRLTDANYLQRIERRVPGGSRGGSGQYVYSLGRRGFYSFFTGRYQPARTVNYHALGIVDCFVVLRDMERDGIFVMRGMSAEPDCWQEVGGVHLKPDLLVDVEYSDGHRMMVFIEMDMATENQRQVRGRLDDYRIAWDENDRFEQFPVVVWVGVDDERAIELSWLIEQGRYPEGMFLVATRETLRALLSP